MNDQEWLDSQTNPEDRAEALKFLRNQAKVNKRNPTRYPCPDCGTPNALSAYEKVHHYHCSACTRRAES